MILHLYFVFVLDNQKTLPILADLARQWLTPPVSSTASERTFSGSGLIVTPRRTRLSPDMVEMMLYVRQNYEKVEGKLGQLRVNLTSEDPDDKPPPPPIDEDDDEEGESPRGSQVSIPRGSQGSGRGNVSRAASVTSVTDTVSIAELSEGKELRRQIGEAFAKTRQEQPSIMKWIENRNRFRSGEPDSDIEEVAIGDNILMGRSNVDPAVMSTFRVIPGKHHNKLFLLLLLFCTR